MLLSVVLIDFQAESDEEDSDSDELAVRRILKRAKESKGLRDELDRMRSHLAAVDQQRLLTIAERDRAALERDQAAQERDRAALERDQAAQERDQVVQQRGALNASNSRLLTDKNRLEARIRALEGSMTYLDALETSELQEVAAKACTTLKNVQELLVQRTTTHVAETSCVCMICRCPADHVYACGHTVCRNCKASPCPARCQNGEANTAHRIFLQDTQRIVL